jgi:hypothetical protein
MSKDKHKGVERRKFALANLPVTAYGRRILVPGHLPAPEAGKSATFRRQFRPTLDITKEIRQLGKAGKVKRRRSAPVASSFGRHIRRTLIVAADAPHR